MWFTYLNFFADAARGLIQNSSKMFMFNSNNSLLQFILEVCSVHGVKKKYTYLFLQLKENWFFIVNIYFFFVQGTPHVMEHFVDSKKDVDLELKITCEEFIHHMSDTFNEPLKTFLSRVCVLRQYSIEFDNILLEYSVPLSIYWVNFVLHFLLKRFKIRFFFLKIQWF